MFKEYNTKIKKILSENKSDTVWGEVYSVHKTMLGRIQHERLIHLLVTIFVGIILMASFFLTIITQMAIMLLLDIPLLILFVAYIFHYRFLENTTQSWYELEDKIYKKL